MRDLKGNSIFRILLVTLVLLPFLVKAQQKITLELVPEIGGTPIQMGEEKNGIRIDRLRFYISKVDFYNNEQLVYSANTIFHLVDIENDKTRIIEIVIPESTLFDQVQFILGIDSATNVSGAMTGDLDPTKGMYWTWQSGFINLKLEGVMTSVQCKNRPFEYHLGGYQPPFKSYITVALRTGLNRQQNIIIGMELSPFFEKRDCQSKMILMSPSQESVVLTKEIAQLFYVHKKE